VKQPHHQPDQRPEAETHTAGRQQAHTHPGRKESHRQADPQPQRLGPVQHNPQQRKQSKANRHAVICRKIEPVVNGKATAFRIDAIRGKLANPSVREFFFGAAIFVLMTVAVGLVRILLGPRDADRMMAAQLLGTGGIAVLLLASSGGLTGTADMALVLALLAVFVPVVFTKGDGANGKESK
jgi:multicomponent Na+:H+ antiporter subunit F